MVKKNSFSAYTVALILCVTLFFIVITTQSAVADGKITVEFFYSSGCVDCEEKEPIIDEIEEEYGGEIVVYRKDISVDKKYLGEWLNYGFFDIPAVVINNETKIPCEEITKQRLKEAIDLYLAGNETNKTANGTLIEIPFFGEIDETQLSQLSLPVLTVILGAVDSVNPCSFFVLLFLLNLLIYAQSRRKMALIGGIFIFFSGFIYFVFMSALLSIFILSAHIAVITAIAGVVAMFLGSLNIKDFFFFKKGLSTSIPDSKKPGLFRQMRKLVKATRVSTMIIGVIVLAISANTYELFCTLGFPMIFTRALTLHNLHLTEYYLYILFYNLVYVIPLCLIVLVFVITLGRRKLTQWQGQVLKLVSGTMMLLLGIVLLFNPALLRSVFTAVAMLVVALTAAGVTSVTWKKYLEKNE